MSRFFLKKSRKRIRITKNRLILFGLVDLLLISVVLILYFATNLSVGKKDEDIEKNSPQLQEYSNVMLADTPADKPLSGTTGVIKGELVPKTDAEQLRNELKQMELAQSSNVKNIGKLKISAPFSGYITDIRVKAGDNLDKGAHIADLTDISKLKLQVPFNTNDVQYLKQGQEVKVFVPAFMSYVNGTVKYVGSKAYYTPDGGALCDVEIQVANPGALDDTMDAGIEINVGDRVVYSYANGKLAYINKLAVKAEVAGTVIQADLRENQFVNAGDLLAELRNDELVLAKEQTALKIENLRRQLRSL